MSSESEVTINIERLAGELIDVEQEGFRDLVSDAEFAEYLRSQSVSCGEEWQLEKSHVEKAKVYDALARAYKRAAEMVEAGQCSE